MRFWIGLLYVCLMTVAFAHAEALRPVDSATPVLPSRASLAGIANGAWGPIADKADLPFTPLTPAWLALAWAGLLTVLLGAAVTRSAERTAEATLSLAAGRPAADGNRRATIPLFRIDQPTALRHCEK